MGRAEILQVSSCECVMCEWLRAVWVGCPVSQKNVATNRGRFYGYPSYIYGKYTEYGLPVVG